MNFIHCFNLQLKNKLLQNGFKLISSNNNLSIFENNSTSKFNFDQVDKLQFIFSNKMIF